ncbi:glycosyltransferase [Hydrogenovibrio thermophilus]|nr:glycosyltransferase [Hydrogenovibrio thermophilus]
MQLTEKTYCLVISSLTGGGAEKLNLDLLRRLQEMGHYAVLIVLESKGADYDYHHHQNIYFLDHVFQKPFLGFLDYPLKAKALEKLIDRLAVESGKPFDCVIASLYGTHRLFARLTMSNVWYWVHCNLSCEAYDQTSKKKTRRYFRTHRKVYKNKKIIAVSQGVRQDLIENFDASPENVKVLHNFFDYEDIQKQAFDVRDIEALKNLESQGFLLHIGRFSSQKRHDLLLKAYRKVNTELPLVLLTKSTPKLKALIDSLGLSHRVVIAGFQANPFVWLKAARLLILSSDYEGFGNVIVEALSLGTPVVSTDCPSGPNEILTGELKNYLVPVGDELALAKRIEEELRLQQATLPVFDKEPFSFESFYKGLRQLC